jgi:hypothetical protein
MPLAQTPVPPKNKKYYDKECQQLIETSFLEVLLFAYLKELISFFHVSSTVIIWSIARIIKRFYNIYILLEALINSMFKIYAYFYTKWFWQ